MAFCHSPSLQAGRAAQLVTRQSQSRVESKRPSLPRRLLRAGIQSSYSSIAGLAVITPQPFCSSSCFALRIHRQFTCVHCSGAHASRPFSSAFRCSDWGPIFTDSPSASWQQTAARRQNAIRCNSGRHVSTSDSNENNVTSSDTSTAEPTKHAHERSTSWTTMVLSLPLELAAVQSHTDNFYLRKRKRKHWWSKEHFPKVRACLIPAHVSETFAAMLPCGRLQW